jgi:GWxTD domain-containing protein
MKWNLKAVFLFPVLLHLLILTGCGGGEKVTKTNAGVPYGGQDFSLKFDIKVFHVDQDSSRIFIRFNTGALLYSRTASENFSARVKVVITPTVVGSEAGEIARPKTIQMADVDNAKAAKDILGSTTIDLKAGYAYSLNIEVIDQNRKQSFVKIVQADKSLPHFRENFIVAKNDLRIPLFTDRIVSGETYIIGTNAAPLGEVYVQFYNRDFPLPPPPFAFYEPRPFDYQPDSTFVIELNEDSKGRFTAANEGFYHFQNDSLQKYGLTLFVSADEFPEVKKIQNMIDPFRYLVSGKEYRNIIEAPDMKIALEKYWIDWTGNKERARSSIQAYYQRVEAANVYFNSHVEGWKSDRGVIYIVYGEPNKVYRNALTETWIYGEENNPLSITFQFVKVINPFTLNDFRLNREDYYKPSWYRAIEAWRNGRNF